MGRSRLAWVGSSVAPWGIALGFLVSITAHAGQEAGIESGANALQALRVSTFAPTRSSAQPILEARLTLGSREDLSATSDEVDPNPTVKQGRSTFPTVDRDEKGDPFIIFRPAFEARRTTPLLAQAPSSRDWPDESRSPARAADAAPPDADALSADASLPFGDGVTPEAPLDFALNSSTPTPSEGKLIVADAKSPAPSATTAPGVATAPGASAA
jgi:hypothetical protein